MNNGLNMQGNPYGMPYPNNMNQQMMPMGLNNEYTYMNDIENRISKIERQIKRLDQRLNRLETPYGTKINLNNPEADNSMYMM